MGHDADVGRLGFAHPAGNRIDVNQLGGGLKNDVAPVKQLVKSIHAHGEHEVNPLEDLPICGDAQGVGAKVLRVGRGECNFRPSGDVDG